MPDLTTAPPDVLDVAAQLAQPRPMRRAETARQSHVVHELLERLPDAPGKAGEAGG